MFWLGWASSLFLSSFSLSSSAFPLICEYPFNDYAVSLLIFIISCFSSSLPAAPEPTYICFFLRPWLNCHFSYNISLPGIFFAVYLFFRVRYIQLSSLQFLDASYSDHGSTVVFPVTSVFQGILHYKLHNCVDVADLLSSFVPCFPFSWYTALLYSCGGFGFSFWISLLLPWGWRSSFQLLAFLLWSCSSSGITSLPKEDLCSSWFPISAAAFVTFSKTFLEISWQLVSCKTTFPKPLFTSF